MKHFGLTLLIGSLISSLAAADETTWFDLPYSTAANDLVVARGQQWDWH